MKTFLEFLTEESCVIYTAQQLSDLEKFADKLLAKWNIDIEFTKHFGGRGWAIAETIRASNSQNFSS